ncbi:hypothetical protein GCM10008983_17650 [Lentibacillus halophilus]|uniref:Uncharacterized protein n=1 Tax=Lentibacillus halophilus TaxID=295065 RepID=A0ABP3J7F4_9BACI
MGTSIQDNYVYCVWPDFVLPLGKSGKDLVNYFKGNYDININYLEAAKTLPGTASKKGRIDQIFSVQKDSIDTFDQIKSGIGALYAKEIVRNKAHYIYNERVFLSYFKRLEDELIKAGELSKDDAYQTLF